MIKDYDHLFKVVIIGDAGVGKSALLYRFSDDYFHESYLTTLGVDFKFKSLLIDKQNVKLQIWDTAGQERFRTITNAYYKGANGIIAVYDVTNPTTFNDIEKYWLLEVDKFADQEVKIMLLGNKIDRSDKQVDTQRAQQFANDKKMFFYEVSAKSAFKVEQAFLEFSKQLINQNQSNQIKSQDNIPKINFNNQKLTKNVNSNNSQSRNKKCC